MALYMGLICKWPPNLGGSQFWVTFWPKSWGIHRKTRILVGDSNIELNLDDMLPLATPRDPPRGGLGPLFSLKFGSEKGSFGPKKGKIAFRPCWYVNPLQIWEPFHSFCLLKSENGTLYGFDMKRASKFGRQMGVKTTRNNVKLG